MIYFLSSERPAYIDYELMDNLLSFSSDYLMLPEEIVIDISFKELLADGFAGFDSEDESYYIEINKSLDNEEDVLLTLFHELTHIKQISSNSELLKEDIDSVQFDIKKYQMLPRELEAHKIEKMMMQLWKER